MAGPMRVSTLIVLALAIGLATAAWLLRPAPVQAGAAGFPAWTALSELDPPPPPPPDPCLDGATQPFSPTRIDIENVDDDLEIMALPRDSRNTPSTTPFSKKFAVAWDRPPGIMPGSSAGNVILNAHTFPDGSALGNAMLANVQEGNIFRLENDETHLCYRITKRVHTSGYVVYPGFYDTEGPPQVAFLVCSGTRLGPGHWTHREIWFASPVQSSAAT